MAKTKKPSPAQLKLLRQLLDGSRVRRWVGIRNEGASYIVLAGQPSHVWGPTVRFDTLWAAYKAGWLRIVKEDWRERVYELTLAGRAIAEEVTHGDDG